MNILRLLTKQFRPFGWSLNSNLIFQHAKPKVKIVSRHVGQAKKFDIWNDKWMHLQYCYSRSYCSQASGNFKLDYEKLDASGNFKLDLEKLDALNIQEIKSYQCRDIILGLVTSYLYPEEQSLGNKDPFIFFTFTLVGLYKNGNVTLQQFREEVSESVGFQNFLKALPSHLENMGVEDLVDALGGLLILGVPVHNSLITNIFYKFLNPELQLGFAELAKLSCVFELYFMAKHILNYGFLVPEFKCLLMNTSSVDKKDLIFLSHLLKYDWLLTYPEIENKYLMLVSDALKNIDIHKEVDNIVTLYIVHGLECCNSYRSKQRKMCSPFLLGIYSNLMDMVIPQIEQFTYEQILISQGKFFFYGGLNSVLCKMHPDYYSKLTNHLIKSLRAMVNTDSLNIWHLKCIQKVGKFDEVGYDEDQRKAIFDSLLAMIKKDDKTSLYVVSQLFWNKELHQHPWNVIKLVNKAVDSLMNVIEANQDERLQNNCLIIMFNLTKACPTKHHMFIKEKVGPYISQVLQSGYGCQNHIFSRLCQIGIRIGHIKTGPAIIDRIRNTILSLDAPLKENSDSTRKILDATYAFGHETDVTKGVETALVELITQKNLNVDVIFELISIGLKNKSRHHMTLATYAIAKKLEICENIEGSLLSILPKPNLLNENMANKLLKYYADHYETTFVNHKPYTVMGTLLNTFCAVLSRQPIYCTELEQLSQKIIESLWLHINSKQLFTFLNQLCQMGICFDEYIKKAFSNDYLDGLYESVKNFTIGRKLESFISLNRHVVLHCKHLDIPWMPHEPLRRLVAKQKKQINIYSIHILSYVSEILGGFTFFRPDKLAYYDLTVDYEYFLDSEDNLLKYDEAKRMIQTDSSIRKCAICYGFVARTENLCNDSREMSMKNKQKIQELESMGYEVKFVDPVRWRKMSDSSERKEFMQNLLGMPETKTNRGDLQGTEIQSIST